MKKFFPDIEPEQAVVQVLTRGDLSSKEKDNLVKNTENSISGVDGILINYAKSGPDGRTKDLIGAVRTIFTDWDEREKAVGLMDQMRSKVKYMEGADINIVAQKEGPGGQGKPIRIEITGSDFTELNNALKKIRSTII